MAKKKIYSKGPGVSERKQKILLQKFVRDAHAQMASKDANVNRRTANLHYRKFREAIYSTFQQAPRLFGEVEIDIAEFGGKGRKKLRALLRKYGRTLTHAEYKEKSAEIRKRYKTQILCFAQRGGLIYAHVITSKKRDDLLPLVRLVVEPGTKIYSDEEPGLKRLKKDGYKHKTINHKEFHAYEAGVHTSNVDAFISFSRRRLAKFNGFAPHVTPLHIKECVWRYNNRNKKEKELIKIIESLMDEPVKVKKPKRIKAPAKLKLKKKPKLKRLAGKRKYTRKKV